MKFPLDIISNHEIDVCIQGNLASLLGPPLSPTIVIYETEVQTETAPVVEAGRVLAVALEDGTVVLTDAAEVAGCGVAAPVDGAGGDFGVGVGRDVSAGGVGGWGAVDDDEIVRGGGGKVTGCWEG